MKIEMNKSYLNETYSTDYVLDQDMQEVITLKQNILNKNKIKQNQLKSTLIVDL